MKAFLVGTSHKTRRAAASIVKKLRSVETLRQRRCILSKLDERQLRDIGVVPDDIRMLINRQPRYRDPNYW
jgi:uncharacterized protein YjiS (DUF1127 family)